MFQLSEHQLKSFYRDGFLVLKGVIPTTTIDLARRNFYKMLGRLSNQVSPSFNTSQKSRDQELHKLDYKNFLKGEDPLYLDLFNKSDVRKSIESMFGSPVYPANTVQLAINFPEDPSNRINEAGYKDSETPFKGWCGHLDGLWNGGTSPPEIGKSMTAYQRRKWYSWHPRNGVPKSHPELNCNIFNFSALIGIPLSDQSQIGVGNVGVLKGAHHKMEVFFKMQWEKGGPLGPGGPGWPRENYQAPNGHGLRHYPDSVREAFRRGAAKTSDGFFWPRPTMIRAKPGDAIIIHFALPHSATRVNGPDPRLMIFFRLSPKRRQKKYMHAYPRALYDIWHEWKGMSNIIEWCRSPERPRQTEAASSR